MIKKTENQVSDIKTPELAKWILGSYKPCGSVKGVQSLEMGVL
jgi:hypothetical protein